MVRREGATSVFPPRVEFGRVRIPMAKAASNTSPEYAAKVALYEKLVATNPAVERKGATMPYTSVSGHMFTCSTRPAPSRCAWRRRQVREDWEGCEVHNSASICHAR